jgi:hypothetical protein
MRSSSSCRAAILLVACACAASSERPEPPAHDAAGSPAGQERNQAAAHLDTARIEELTGLKGTLNEAENVFKVTAARTDVPVTVDGRVLEPFMGLTSWAAFMPGTKAPCLVMGDLVLFQDEVNPVMSAALDHGLSVTALHNHFFFDEPKVYFMHIDGEGAVDALAGAVHAAFGKVKEIRAATPRPAASSEAKSVPEKSSITSKPLEDILGAKGQAKDGMFKVVIGRTTTASCGCTIGKEMGVNTWAGFAGTDDRALVDGDFAVREHELQAVLKALRKSGIDIVAIHSHMTGENPRVLFLHYWGRGKARDLASGLKSALEVQDK